MGSSRSRRGNEFEAMKRLLPALVTLVAASTLAACGGESGSSGPVTLNFWAYNEPGGTFRAAAENCTEDSGGRYRIAFNPLGNDPNTQRQSLVRRLAAEDSSIDLMSMDVIWTAEFAEAGWIKAWPEDRAQKIRQGTLKGPIGTATYQGRLYAAPANSNTQLLWYRKDKTPDPPQTWKGLIDKAAQEGSFVEIQGADYEGVVVWFNSLIQSAGGSIVQGQGDQERVGLQRGPTMQALETMADLGKRAANPSISTQKEDQNRLAFETGQSIFQVNYPFIYPSAKENAKDLFKQLAWAPYPRVDANQASKAPIGGFNWGVGAYTKHPEEAFDAAACMRDERNQREFAITGGLPPTLESIYDDPKFQKQYPFGDVIRRQLDDAAVRPVSPSYADISLAISTTVSPPTQLDPAAAYDELRTKVEQALESKGLL
jgi:multiple sugar transport system substrate-binding protein